MPPRPLPVLALLIGLSGAAALVCEVVWMRRLALVTGSTGIATTATLSLYFGGLGVGGAWAGRRRWSRAPRGYGLLELGAATWVILFPALLAALKPLWLHAPSPLATALGGGLLLVPPAVLLGATLPAVSSALGSAREVGALYTANTAGAVVGTLLAPFLLIPTLGVRGSEWVAVAGSGGAGLGALWLARTWGRGAGAPAAAGPVEGPSLGSVPVGPASEGSASEGSRSPGRYSALAVRCGVGIAGACAMALEVAWSRLAALLLGGSVYAMAVVLAVFLGGIAVGAALGRRGDAEARFRLGLVALGILALGGTVFHPWLPHLLGSLYASTGPGVLIPGGSLLLALSMGGAPVASGMVFTAGLRALERAPRRGAGRAGDRSTWNVGRLSPRAAAGQVLAWNTLGGVLGSAAAGFAGLPLLGVRGVVLVVAGASTLAGAVLPGGSLRFRGGAAVAVAALLLLSPSWDASLYAVGLYARLSEFADLSPEAVDRFAHRGWVLRSYADGRTATVAVGESEDGENRWLSINGKVDASTGRDMRTQRVSGWLPVRVARHLQGGSGDVGDVLVVGLASGVTARAVLEEGARSLTVVELEPEVVRASRFFHDVNHRVLADPRTRLVIGDARAFLARADRRWQVMVSEPSNPWITGVSNLFTREYWALARGHLDSRGVFCQWVQLYSLPPEAFRSLVRTFLEVFPRTWLFETIPGADALLVAAPEMPRDPGLAPLLDPAALHRLARDAPLNTDDHPWVEFEAPRWLHRATAERNEALIREAAAGGGE